MIGVYAISIVVLVSLRINIHPDSQLAISTRSSNGGNFLVLLYSYFILLFNVIESLTS